MKSTTATAKASKLPKICLSIIIIYLTCILAFYFLAGEQLKLRESRGNIELPTAETGCIELVQGTTIEQLFSAKIQRLTSIDVQWGTYYRTNSGTVTIELLDTRSNNTLIKSSFDASTISEGQRLTLTAEEPIDGLYEIPLLIRIYSDSLPGAAATPLMNNTSVDDWQLSFNGEPVDGTLCFSASGEDYIWTGLHYWEFAAVGAILLVVLSLIVLYKYKKGKHSYILNAFTAIDKYRFLIRQLISRDFKTKYKRSVLGMFWSFLNPLLTMCVQYFVFSTIFKSDVPNYAAYLLIGIITFNFFSEACGMALTSIIGNASLITKVYMPKYIYPLTRVMSSVVNLGISLIPMILVCLFTGVRFEKSAILAIFFLLCLIIFSLGLGLLLSSSMVFFRDTQFLWGVFSMMWMYATPVFYPESILPDNLRGILDINPLYYIVKSIRVCILDGISPEPIMYVICMLMALGMLLIGSFIFCKSQKKFVLYL